MASCSVNASKAPNLSNPTLLTEGNIANVVTHGSVGIFQLQRWFPVAKEDLWGCVAGSASFFELLQGRSTKQPEENLM